MKILTVTTVGELKKALSEYSDNTPIQCTGADCGGYDVQLSDWCHVFFDGKTLRLDGDDESLV